MKEYKFIHHYNTNVVLLVNANNFLSAWEILVSLVKNPADYKESTSG